MAQLLIVKLTMVQHSKMALENADLKVLPCPEVAHIFYDDTYDSLSITDTTTCFGETNDRKPTPKENEYYNHDVWMVTICLLAMDEITDWIHTAK